MHGTQYSGSLFFHLNGKANNYKDSILLALDDEVSIDDPTNLVQTATANMSSSPKNVNSEPKNNFKLPLITDSITANTFDPGAIITELDMDIAIEKEHEKDHDTYNNDNKYIKSRNSYKTLNKNKHCKMDQHPFPYAMMAISPKSKSPSPIPSNLRNMNLIDSSSYATSIDCEVVLDEVPKVRCMMTANDHVNVNIKRSNHRNKSLSRINKKHEHGINKSIFNLPVTVNIDIHPMLHPNLDATNMDLSMYQNPKKQINIDAIANILQNNADLSSNLPSKRKYSLDMNMCNNHSNHSNYSIDNNLNGKAFEPDVLDIDRKDNNSYRDNDLCDDDNWWLNGAYFDDTQLEFEYDPDPEFIYYGVEI